VARPARPGDRARAAEHLSAREYLAHVSRLGNLARSAALRDVIDVIASPTLCVTPPPMSDVADAESHLRVNRRIVRNTVGQLSLPGRGDDAGRPRPRRHAGRAAVDCPAQAEELLLAIAMAAERVLGTGADRLGNRRCSLGDAASRGFYGFTRT
jgi:hypothetical protein